MIQVIRLYRQASKKTPHFVAFGTCLVKGSTSDAFAQKCVEGVDTLDIKRNLAFSIFSGAYLGCGQHFVYNVWFTRLFGASTSLQTGLKKSAMDLFVHVPLVYLPLYYAFEDTALGGTPVRGIQRLYAGTPEYAAELPEVMTKYSMIFPLVHVLNFTVIPREMRIAVVATVSFAWLVVLSTVSHK